DIALIVDWFARLTAIVERDRVRPHVLAALALLLRIVLPVNGVPEEVDLDVVLERGPHGSARIGGRPIDDDRADPGPRAVVEPALAPLRALGGHALAVEVGGAGGPC